MNAFALLLVLAQAAVPPAAAPADSARLTLHQVVERAVNSYPTVGAARAQRERAAADLRDAQSAWLPRLTLDASLVRFQEPMVVHPLHGFDPRNPPLFDRTLIQSGATLSYTLLDFGIRSGRVGAQRALGRAADAALDQARQQLVARVAGTYLRVIAARQLLGAHDQRLAALSAAAGRARQLEAEGKAARIEVLRVEAELRRADADRIGGTAQLETAEHELAQLASLPYDVVRSSQLQPVRPSAAARTDSAGPGRPVLVERARAAAPEVRELRGRAEAARSSLGAARATRLPELRVSTGYIDRGRWWGDFTPEWQVGALISYPLYTGGSRSSAIRRAAAEATAAAELLRAAELAAEQGVDRALAALRESRARVAALESAVEQSAEVARIERLSVEVGSGTQTDYLESEANLLRTRAGLIEARHAEITAAIELARIQGELSGDWLARTMESLP